MDPIIILAIIAVFGGSFAFMFIQMKKQKETTKKYESPTMIAKSEEFQKELLSQLYEPLTEAHSEEPIIAFTECAYISNLGEKTKDTLLTGLKVIGWGAMGVKAKYQQVDNAAYLVLTNEHLHYLLFEEGEITDTFSLTKEQLTKAKVTDLSSTDQATRVFATAGNKVSKKIVIGNEGQSFDIIFFDRITKDTTGTPVADYTTGVKDVLGKNRIMGIRFKDKLVELYPNLRH
jgi:hypothetical protein